MPNDQSINLLAEALQKLKDALKEAAASGVSSPRVMTLATVSNEGNPSIRSIELADVDSRGPLFFVNTTSGKGIQLANNPQVALCFYWAPIDLQIICEGVAEKEQAEVANNIWSRRGRAKQLAAWASKQSQESEGPSVIAERVSETQKEFSDQRVPLPEHWAGIRVLPTRIEVWHSGWQRMKDRASYVKENGQWKKYKLEP